jgi:lipopolysaccharide transport system ATP-binding protein
MRQYEAGAPDDGLGEHSAYTPPKAFGDGRLLTLNVNRFGSQEVEITDVRLLNMQGAEICRMLSGASLTIEIAYEARALVRDPKASVEIHGGDGTVCFDTNTEVGGLVLETVEGKGILRLRIDRLDLADGDYSMSVGLYAHDWKFIYDYHAQAYSLGVIGVRTGKGFLYPPLKWEVVMDARAVGASNALPAIGSNVPINDAVLLGSK